MYLSHYVDIPPEFMGETCDANDEDPYYANWITNDDRDTYESFIRVINGTKALELFMDLLDTAKSAKGNLAKYQIEMINKGYFPFANIKLKKLLDVHIISGKNSNEYFEAKFEETSETFNYIDEDTPADEVISIIQEKLGEDFGDSEILDSVSDAFTAALEFSQGSANLISLVFTVVKAPLIFMDKLAPNLAVVAMLNSVSGRLALLVMRAIGGR